MSVTAVLLNYNTPDLTLECVAQLQKIGNRKMDILVVDNASTDNSVDYFRDSNLPFEVVVMDENRGFAGGMNAGIDAALASGSDYVWILNNDIEFPDGFDLGALVETLENEDVGVVTPLVRDPSGDIWFSKSELDREAVNARNLAIELNGVTETDHMPLVAALVDAEVLREVALPLGYFLYWEDVEWPIRVREAGWRLVTNPSVEVIHDDGSSSNQALKSYYTARNRWIIYRRLPTEFSRFYFPYLWMMVKLSVGRIIQRESDSLLALWRGIFDGARGQTGRGRYP